MKTISEEMFKTLIVEELEKMLVDKLYEFRDPDLHFPVCLIMDTLETINDCEFCEDDFDTNGCAWDWNLRFSYKGTDFVISGSGYDGGLYMWTTK